ncbi:hypothetical protein DM02DRAFT_619058 [Periconia macrospinosa]|uniref:Maintenance of telomere capping protein 6 n=1 Tax=Periconia macrospinosa TaxID=97972 RepID=A0A2V1D6P0_9PLEO|nr:hypothetical protein DM02DRAFT_619058 [Periconia macrospinosa]
MSDNNLYKPDQTALDTVTEPWSEALRAQRDLGLLVPINFHVVPSISLRAACFNNYVYSDRAFQKCFSNLLALGLRRFNVDVYWDQIRSQWSLCPVEIVPPGSDSNLNSSSSTSASDSTSSPSSSSFSGSRSATFTARGTTTALPSLVPPLTATVEPRQASSISSSVSTSSTASITSSQPLSSTGGNGFGPYNCTASLTLSYLTDILSDFLDITSTTTDATVIFLLLNIHAAAPRSSPTSPAQQPTQLPNRGNFISDAINGNLSSNLYTPQKLEAQRADLDDNDGWLSGDPDTHPASGYYETHQENGQLATSDGWPTEAFLVFRRVERLIVSFGSIDPQMSNYNLTVDESTIFSTDTIRQLRPATFNPDGTISSGCLFIPSESSITETTNSSWASAPALDINVSVNSDLQAPIPSVGNLTSCGLSAFLNTTLANTTADQNPLPYAVFMRSSMWTFIPGEPSNGTVDNNTIGRCTAMLTNGSYPGRWRTVDCTNPLRAACQNTSVPYRWEISSERGSYGNAQSLCPPGLRFSVPHTPLENSHLYAAALASESASQNHEPILVNLNSLDVEDCWVSGENATCPYLPPTDTDRARVVVVPTVAAVIIFVCAALTFFVKCAANRREDKRGRRRRMVGGWEYEGVPS